MQDKMLRQTIIDELDFDPSIDSSAIGVAVEHGVVTLTGHTGSFAEKSAAERAVRRVKGVRAIAQEIEVRFADDKKTADDQIAERAIRILDWNAQVPRNTVTVRVQKGWVTLNGTVQWQYQRMAAESAIRKLSGVVGMSNLIEVQPSADPHDVRKKIVDALKRNAELESGAIQVKVDGNKVILEGQVKAWYERDLAERAAWSAPGVAAVEDKLAIA